MMIKSKRTMAAYYNEIDPYAAQWLRNLISKGLIAPGDVDERSIEDVHPSDLKNYAQCHFFAGIGIWSYALRRAGWPDDKPVWTGSCPCQPFSSAGKGAGFDDERHLWPAWNYLIDECRPAIIFGEQVASKNAEPWIDLVSDDLETLGYAVGAVPFPAASVGSPHIRDRLYWMAYHNGERLGASGRRCAEHEDTEQRRSPGRLDNTASSRHVGPVEGAEGEARHEARLRMPGEGCGPSGMGHAGSQPGQRDAGSVLAQKARVDSEGRVDGGIAVGLEHASSGVGGMDDSCSVRRLARWVDNASNVGQQSDANGGVSQGQPPTGPTDGFWRAADWLLCRDGKWRPVEPGTFPLAHGATARVGRLRAYGNAIVAPQAQVFIETVMDWLGYGDL